MLWGFFSFLFNERGLSGAERTDAEGEEAEEGYWVRGEAPAEVPRAGLVLRVHAGLYNRY